MNSKNKNIRDLYRRINEPGSNLVKDDNGDLLADTNTILNRWKSYFSHLLNVHSVSDVRHIEIHTAEPIVSGPSHSEIEIYIAKLKKYCDMFDRGPSLLCNTFLLLRNRGRTVPWMRSPLGIVALHGNQQ
jgi:hypothetical protein